MAESLNGDYYIRSHLRAIKVSILLIAMSLLGAIIVVHAQNVKAEQQTNKKIQQIERAKQQQKQDTEKKLNNQQQQIEQLKKDVQARNDRKKAASEAAQATLLSRAIETVIPTAHASASPLGGGWAALRQCESGGNYANSSNPQYRGAYQFSYATWAAMGGSGDPAAASPAEQDQRALSLYQRSGAGQWPVCGRYL